MIKPEYITIKAYTLSDNELRIIIFDGVATACRMLVATTKDEAIFYLIDNVIMKIIRRSYNDFTCQQIDSCFEAAAYGIYGQYHKITGMLIISWLQKKREEVFQDEEKNERAEALKNRNEKHLLASNNGGYAVLLGLFYHESKMNSIPFESRLKLIEEKGICPNTKRPVFEVINKYLSK